MVNQSFLINNINAVKDGFSINAKVVRLWRQYYYGGDTLASMDMILMDQQGSRISASISHKMVYQFESLLKEGGSVNLSNFYVAKNNADYRVANHAFKINFHRKTKVKSIPSVFPSKYGFAFVPFTEFLEDKVVQEQAVDVIGCVAAVGEVVHGQRRGKPMRRMVVELEDFEGRKIQCTIWDAWIDAFRTKMDASSDHIKVCIFQFGSVRKYKGSISVSNTFYSTRFFINDDIPEIAEFRSRLLERVGDDTSSLHVSTLTTESSEASEEKYFFAGSKMVNLDQLMDVDQISACTVLATITSIEYEEGWVYTGCCECKCKAVPNDDQSNSTKTGKRKIRNTYKCETCGPDVFNVIPMFKVQVRVSDDSACASFVMFDREVFSIVDRSANVLKEEEAKKPNKSGYPDDLNALIGKKLLFRVDVTRYNLFNNHAVYTVGRLTSSEVFIKAFIKLYADEMAEVENASEDGYDADTDSEEPIAETNQNLNVEASPSKDVESSMADNVLKVQPHEVAATPPQGKCGIAPVDKDNGAPSVTSRNKKKYMSRKDKVTN